MIALIRYRSATLVLSQRYLAPLLLFVGLVAVLTSGDNGPRPAMYSAVGVSMLLSSVWLTMALSGIEDPVHRSVVRTAAGGALRLHLGTTATALLWCLPLVLAGLLIPSLSGAGLPVRADVLLGVETQLACAFVGVAVGLICSPPLLRSRGHALTLALGLILLSLLARHVSPVNLLLTELQGAERSGELLGSAGLLLVLSAAVLVAVAALTHAVTVRRS